MDRNGGSSVVFHVNLLNDNEDIIRTNQKVRQILAVIQKECSTVKQLREVFSKLNAESLRDASFAVKFAIMGASSVFHTIELFGQRVKNLSLGEMQDNYEKADEIKEQNEEHFYNSVTLLGEFYHRARQNDGHPMSILVMPLMEYMKMFYSDLSNRGAKEFAAQIYQNGAMINRSHPKEMEKLMLSVRQCLIEIPYENKLAKMWYLICIDLINNNFKGVPKYLEQLYMEILKKEEHNLDKPKPKPKMKTNEQLEARLGRSLSVSNSTPNLSTRRISNSEKSQLAGSSVRDYVNVNYDPKPSDNISNAQITPTMKPTTSASNDTVAPISKENVIEQTELKPTNNSPKAEKSTNALKSSNGVECTSLKEQTKSSANDIDKNASPKLKPDVKDAKVSKKAYLKEENVENLTWVQMDPDKVYITEPNPYSELFMKYMNNHLE